MCNVGNTILNSVLTFASVWIVRKFLDTFYEKKRWNVLSVSVWSIYIIFQGYVQFHSGDASTLTTIVNVLLCIMISAISYYGFGKNNIFLLGAHRLGRCKKQTEQERQQYAVRKSRHVSQRAEIRGKCN